MKISDLQKVTLIDYPGKIACTIFLFGCNFRCGFCHNKGLVIKADREEISQEDVLKFLEKRKKYLGGVCITGGEPLMTLKEDFLRKIKKLNYSIKIDTNGSFPGKLKEFIVMGLVDYVAMDIKASGEKYSEVVNAEVELGDIEKSIKIISLFGKYEFRTTILEEIHIEEEVLKMAKWLNQIVGEKPKKFVLQGFKVQGELLDAEFQLKKDTSEEYLIRLKNLVEDYFEEVEIRV